MSTKTRVHYPGCECARCERIRLLARRDDKQRRLGVYKMVDTVAAVEHLRLLGELGWPMAEVSRIIDVSQVTLSELRRGIRPRCRRETVMAVLAFPARPPTRLRLVNAIPTLRRVEALAAIGYPCRDVCRMAGLNEGYAREAHYRNRCVRQEQADAIAKVYDRLHMHPAEDNYRSRRARAIAYRRGWVPPFAWDDIDDLDEQPKGVAPPPKELAHYSLRMCATRLDVLEGMVRKNATLAKTLAELGCSRDALYHWCRWHDCMCLYQALGNPRARDRLLAGYKWQTVKPAGEHRPQRLYDEAVVLRVLAGEYMATSHAERAEILARWVTLGGSQRSMCERMGWKSERYKTGTVAS